MVAKTVNAPAQTKRTFRKLLGVCLFLFGTTFVWMTAPFSGTTPPPTGTAWTLSNVFALGAVIAFAVGTWAVVKRRTWWRTSLVVAGIVGLTAVVPFVLAQSQLETGFADMGVQINMWMHIVGSVAVVVLVVWPVARDWVAHRL